MIKVISYGKKGEIETAQIVIIKNGKSRTVHVWFMYGNVYSDKWGIKYDLP